MSFRGYYSKTIVAASLGSARPYCSGRSRLSRLVPSFGGSSLIPLWAFSLFVSFAFVVPAYSQVTWLFSPYRVQIFIQLENAAPLTEDDLAQLHKQLAERLSQVFGNRWELQVTGFPADLPAALLNLSPPPSPQELPARWKKAADWDKITVVNARKHGLGWTVQVREWDVPLEQWGPLVVVSTPNVGGLLDAMTEAVLRGHIPIGEVQVTEEQTVRLALRGGLLSGTDSHVPSSPLPALFVACARYEDREGNARAIIPLPFTVLKPVSSDENAGSSGIACEVISGIRNPLSARRRGRVRIYARAAQPALGKPTVLRLRSREQTQEPLVGYEIYTQENGEGPLVFRGRTDPEGEITIPGSEVGWYLVSIRHGRRLLARVPVVSGHNGPTELSLPNDDPRLVAETYLSGLQDELVDLVTLRSVLTARMRARMIAEDWEAAQRIRDQLLKLKSREVFSSELTRQQQRIYCPDPVGQKQIDMMFAEMQRLVNVYLNPQEVEQLVKLLSSRQKPATGS